MKCHHEPCTCKTEPGREYCSHECQSSLADEGATDCHCGHAQCAGTTEANRDSER